MDRYEYKVREEEIMKLAGERRWNEAAELADTIDWSRVRSVTTLCKISDVYKGSRRFQESKEILLMAYKKYPENRRIVYALCLRSIQLEEFVQAIEYYKEFVQLAPKDTDRYILQYKIYEAQDVSLEERAAVLEEYKSKDYKPKWGYELAYLYHRMGLGTKCIDECEELIATFGEGKYVIKAMELKALHEPLTGAEQAEYERYMQDRDRSIMSGEETPKEIPESIQDMGNSTLEEEDLKEAPTAEIEVEFSANPEAEDPDDNAAVPESSSEVSPEDIEVKPVDVGQYNTINLQAALAESLKDIWGDDTGELPKEGREGSRTDAKLAPSVPEEGVDDNTIFEPTPLAAVSIPAQEPVKMTPEPRPLGPLGPAVQPAPVQMPPVEQIISHIPSVPEPGVDDNTIFEPTPLTAAHIEPVRELSPTIKKPEDTKPIPNPTLIEQTKRIPTDTIVDYLETKQLVREIRHSTATMQASSAQAEKIPGAVTGQLDISGTGSALYDQMLAEEYNGQIRLAMAEAEKVEKQITGQLSIDDVLADWEEAKKENEKKREEEVRKRIVQHTGSLFDEFDEDTKATLIEQLEKAFRDAILKESADGDIDEEALGKKIRKEALRTVEYMTADGVIGEGLREAVDSSPEPDNGYESGEDDYDIKEPEETDDDSEEDEIHKTGEADASEVGDDEAAEGSGESDEEETGSEETDGSGEEDEAGDPEEVNSETDSIGVAAVKKALEEDEDTEKGKKKKPVEVKHYATDSEGKRILSEDEEELFKPFLNRRGARKQIISALDNMSMAAYSGNCIVTGEEGTGTIDLAKRLIKHMQATDSNFLGNQVAMVTGKNLNGKDLPALLNKINGGAIIIQSARGMKKSTVQKLISALENENLGLMAILEDTSEGMDRIVGTLPKLGEIFNARIDLQALDDKALVSYACEYALSQEHSIDEFALLAIHTRIGEMQTSDHQVTVAEVRDLVDDAIFYADKKNPSHFFDIILHKRYDDDDMIILREKDFMHY